LLIVSYLTSNPKLEHTPADEPIASFLIAGSHVYIDDLGMKHTAPQMFQCLAFGELAAVAHAHLQEGQHVIIVGTLAPSVDNASSIHVSGIQVIDHREKEIGEAVV
jgi:single-stranded DNA-binding protein